MERYISLIKKVLIINKEFDVYESGKTDMQIALELLEAVLDGREVMDDIEQFLLDVDSANRHF